MSSLKQTYLAIAVMIVTAMVIFPPWKFIDGSTAHPMGYGPIWQPPVSTRHEGVNLFGLQLSLQDTVKANAIDWQRLIYQCGAVVLIAGAGIFVAGLAGRRART